MSAKQFVSVVVLATLVAPQFCRAATGDSKGKLLWDAPNTMLYFGLSVAIDGNTVLVGAPDWNENAGSAYIFNAANGTLIHKILPNDSRSSDQFGSKVAVRGNIAVIGDYTDTVNGPYSGSTYLFDVASGTQLFKLTPNDGAPGDGFGNAVAIDGTTVLVGASGRDDDGQRSGAAYLFNATTGAQIAKFRPNDGSFYESFGGSVAISGNTAIIGASNDHVNGSESGSAYLYDTTTGNLIAKLLPSDGGAGSDFLGTSVAISGNVAIVGVPGDDDKGLQSGSAYLFDATTGQQIAKLLANDGMADDSFGESVAISGNTAIIGADNDDDKGTNSGSAYLFDITTRTQIAKLSASDLRGGDRFGNAVGISGNLSVVGAYAQNYQVPDTGAAYLFDATNPVPEPNLLASTSLTCAVAGLIERRRSRTRSR